MLFASSKPLSFYLARIINEKPPCLRRFVRPSVFENGLVKAEARIKPLQLHLHDNSLIPRAGLVPGNGTSEELVQRRSLVEGGLILDAHATALGSMWPAVLPQAE